MKLIASNAFSIGIIGKIGPKISSCITGSVGKTSIRMVGSINFSFASVFPPIASLPELRKPDKRLKLNTFLVNETL